MATKQNPYTRRHRDLCWICEESPADSQEHSIKASRIKQMESNLAAGEHLLVPGKAGRLYPIRGKKSQVVKFGETMCQKCNNERTKKFDQAYDRLISFLLNDYDYFRSRRQFSWADIYSDCDFDQRHLQRYYVKNAGCRMIDAGAEQVPQELRQYLYDLEAFPTFSLVLYKDYQTADLLSRIEELGSLLESTRVSEEPGPFTNPYANYATANHAGELFQPGDELYSFAPVLQDGPIGGLFQWEHPKIRTFPLISFNLDTTAFIRDRTEFDQSPQTLLGGWDAYADVARAGLKLGHIKKEMDELLAEKGSIEKGDVVRAAAWRLRVTQLQSETKHAIGTAYEVVARFKEQTGWSGQGN